MGADISALVNNRTPVLDLDTLYGHGPDDPRSAALYKDHVWLRLGEPDSEGDVFDFAINPQSGFPWIADRRTGENLILRQMLATLSKLHNAAVRQLSRDISDPHDLFKAARSMTVRQYQYLVREDWLHAMLDLEVYKKVCVEKNRSIQWETFSIPIEFSMAAMRFGHSMVRSTYLADSSGQAIERTIEEILERSGQPGPLEKEWHFEWRDFFTGVGNVRPISHNKIDTFITNGLREVPGIPETLPAMALIRGARVRLPSGYAVADSFGVQRLTHEELYPVTSWSVRRQGDIIREAGMLDDPPLWYYLLRESAVRNDGVRLGPVASHIVAETIEAALLHDPDSHLNVPGWQLPAWDGRGGNPINTLTELFRYLVWLK